MTEDESQGRPQRGRRQEADDAAGGGGEPERNGAAEGRRTSDRAGRGRTNGGPLRAAAVARRAAQEVAELTGADVETVIAIERSEDGWTVGVEVVETRRIPDSADILATYEVRLDGHGELVSYRRDQRYARGQLYGGRR